jgi:hypothetical protein
MHYEAKRKLIAGEKEFFRVKILVNNEANCYTLFSQQEPTSHL